MIILNVTNAFSVITLIICMLSSLAAQCVSLPDDRAEGLTVSRPDPSSVLVPFKANVTLTCGNSGRSLRNTATSGFRQCVYDPKSVSNTTNAGNY